MTSRPGRRPLRLPRIDEGPGPAERIREDAARALVEAAMSRHLRRSTTRSRARRYAVAAGMICLLAALLAAAFLWVARRF